MCVAARARSVVISSAILTAPIHLVIHHYGPSKRSVMEAVLLNDAPASIGPQTDEPTCAVSELKGSLLTPACFGLELSCAPVGN